MADTRPFKLAIVGGGIAGVTLAIGLHRRNIQCEIYEQAHKFGEVGAGFSFTLNAVKSMQILDPAIHDAYVKTATHNMWESKDKVWFDFLDGMENTSGPEESKFTIYGPIGQNGVHRAAFLDNLVHLLPEGMAHFQKRLEQIEEDPKTGKLTLRFADGTTAEADAVVGTDGIKSRVRQAILGESHPSVHPQYTHKYAYRGLIPMDKAIEAVGEERAKNACLRMGENGHILTYPVAEGKKMNLAGFVTDPNDWPDHDHLTRHANHEQIMNDYKAFGPKVQALIKLMDDELDCWAIFDTFEHPLPSYVDASRPIVVMGDAAHASSPHHGAGAGMAVEDSAIMCSLLSHPSLRSSTSQAETSRALHTAFKVFDAVRRDRTQALVSSSRFVGEMNEWQAKDVGKDYTKMEKEFVERNGKISGGDPYKMCEQAGSELESALKNLST